MDVIFGSKPSYGSTLGLPATVGRQESHLQSSMKVDPFCDINENLLVTRMHTNFNPRVKIKQCCFSVLVYIFTVATAGEMKPDKRDLVSKHIQFLSSKYLHEEHR